MRDGRRLRGLVAGGLAVAAVAVVATGSAHWQTSVPDGEWHHFGRDGLQHQVLAAQLSPPVLRGAEKPYMQVPGAGGGANWQGAAVDVETGRLFVSSSSTLIVVEVIEYPPPATVGYFTDPWGVGMGGHGAAAVQAAVQAGDRARPEHRRPGLDAAARGRPQKPPGISGPEPAAARRRWRHHLGTTGDPDAADHEPRRTGL